MFAAVEFRVIYFIFHAYEGRFIASLYLLLDVPYT